MAGAKPGVHVVQLRPISVPETLIKGNKFIKWDDSSTIGVPVTLKVDPKGYILYWKDQNKDMDFIDISLIRDTRTGKYAKVPKEGKLRDSCTIGPPEVPLEDKTLTIAFNKEPLKANMVDVDFINFVCASMDAAKEWCDELLRYAYNLISLNGSALTYLEKAYIRLIHVLDVNGRISVKNIIKMVATQKEDRRRVEKALEAVGLNAGKNDTIDPAKFTFEDFFNFYRHLVGRTEVDKVFDEIGAKKKPYLTVDQFRQFLNKEQRDPRLNEILYPYYTIKQAQEFINNYETKNGMAAKGHLSQEGFLKFLMSEENNLIPLDQLDQSHDMTAPLAHYFINSSHNTYLTGHQFNSKSSVELYRQVLLSGCRCIELDCWNGSNADEEPIITHGYTMCTDVPFKDVIEAIAESAFKTSKYPVILSFENHCSVKQQAKMASYCRSIFGDLLLIDPLSAYPLEAEVPLPSPNLLQEKIIIKNKKKHFDKKPSEKPPVRQTSSISGLPSELTREDSENGLSSPTTTTTPITPMTMGATPKLRPEGEGEDNSKMINLTNVAEEDSSDSEYEEELPEAFDNENKKKFKDDKGTAGSEAEAGLEMSALVNYVQPVHFHSFEVSERRSKSYEISSFVETQATNLLKEHPVEFVNYNKRQLSRIYPKGTRVDSSNFLPQIFWNAGCQLVALNFQTLDLAMQLNLGIFEYNNRSGYILKPDFMRRTDRKFDPFAESPVDGIVAGTVSVKVISGSLLSDKRIGTYVEVDMYGLPTDTVRKKFKTHLVPNNGINPVYDEPPFEFKKIVLPNLAVIRLSVYDENNKMLGHRVLNVEGLRPGYRHIPLRNANNLPLLLPTLFVHISVKDYVPDDMEMITSALENPIAYQTELERHEKQLRILEDTEQESFKGTPAGAEPKSPERVPNARNGSFKATPLSESKKVSSHPDIKKGDSNDDEFSQEKSNKLQRLWRSMSTRTFKKRRPVVRNSQSKLVGLPSTTGSIESNGTSVVSRTKLNDPVHLSPSTLKDLMSKKPYVKAAAKRDKELDALKKKHEKARENLKEVHELQEERLLISQVKSKTAMEKAHAKSIKKALKSGTAEEVDQTNTTEYQRLIREHDEKHKDLRGQQASELAEMCKTQFLAELNLQLKYHEPLYSLLEELLDVDHRNHLKRLKETYDAEIEDINKSMETQRKSEVRSLSKMYKDKEELSRRKREAQNRHIQLVVEQRKKLENVYERKQLEVTKILASAKEEFEKEKKAVPQRLQDAYEEKCRKLSEHLDGALRHSKENVADSGESNTKL